MRLIFGSIVVNISYIIFENSALGLLAWAANEHDRS